MVFTAPEHETALRSAMNFGLLTHAATGTDRAAYWGVNGKLTEVGAAIGLAVAFRMAERVSARQEMAAEWVAALQGLSVVPFSTGVDLSPWQVFPVLMPDEPTLLRFATLMADQGIETRRYYAPSLGACAGMRVLGPCPNAQALAVRAITLPVRSFLSPAERHEIIATTCACLELSLSEGPNADAP